MGKELIRYQDWPSRLGKEFKLGAERKFKYGKHDCCLSICNCVKVITGVDVAMEFRGYTNRKGAFDWIKKHGSVEGIAEYITNKYNMDEIKVKKMSAGDVGVLIDDKKQQVLCMMSLGGRNVFCTSGKSGWILVGRDRVKRAWRV